MEIIKNFGISPVLLVAQIVNFLIVFYFLKRFLYKPIVEMLKKREEAIKDGIKKSEEANTRLARIVEEEKEILREANLRAKKIAEDTKAMIMEQTRQTEENTKKVTEKMLSDAKEQIVNEAKETEKRLTLNISKIAVKFLEKSIKGIFSEKEQKGILEKAVGKLKVKSSK